jgi:cell division protease FtsH
LGFIEYSSGDEPVFVGRELSHQNRDFSEATAMAIDQEVRRIIDDCYARASKILHEHKDKLIVLAQALLEYETLDGDHVKEIVEHGKLLNPPSKRPKNPMPPSSEETVAKPAVATTKEKGVDPLPPGTIPSPA